MLTGIIVEHKENLFRIT